MERRLPNLPVTKAVVELPDYARRVIFSPLHNRRFFPSPCEAPRFLKIDVHARERLTVSVVNGHAPVMVFTTPISPELRSFALRHGPVTVN